MIWFNGQNILDVAQVKIVDIRVGPIQMTPTARQRPIQWGADFVRMSGGTRTVTIEFALLEQYREDRQNGLLALSEWARQVDVGRLEIIGHENRYLMAACTALPEPSTRQWWESKLTIVFTCFDPFWIDAAESSKAFSSGSVQAYIPGSAPALTRITWTNSAVSDWSFSDGTRTMAFEDLPAGNIEIDLNRQTIACGGVSAMSKFVLSASNSFIRPAHGSVTITCTTAAADIPTLHWRARWE